MRFTPQPSSMKAVARELAMWLAVLAALLVAGAVWVVVG